MKKIIAVALLMVSIHAKSQNLIPNPSFELHDTCPDAPAQLRFCTNWYSPTSTTPDYFYRCTDSSITPPFVQEGIYQWPKKGVGEIGICLIQPNNSHITYREYAQVKLNDKLVKGNKYRYNQFINCGVSPVSGRDLMLASNNAGILFSTYPLVNYSPFVSFPNFCYIPQKPQINFSQVISDTLNWTLQTAEFIADSAYEYLTIGNFMPDSLTSHFGIGDTSSGSSFGAYYLYDDVSLFDMGKDSANGINERQAVGKLQVYPNPASQSLVISSKSLVNTIEVTNVLGQVCISIINYKSEIINVQALQSGIYFIKATDSKGNRLNGKFVKE